MQVHNCNHLDIVGTISEQNAERKCTCETAAYIEFDDRI